MSEVSFKATTEVSLKNNSKTEVMLSIGFKYRTTKTAQNADHSDRLDDNYNLLNETNDNMKQPG